MLCIAYNFALKIHKKSESWCQKSEYNAIIIDC